MSEQSTVDADVQVTEPSVPPPPPPDAADLPRAVSVAPEVTGVDDSAVDHSWLSELETAAPLSAATATAAAAAAPVEAQKRPGFLARAFGRAPAAARPRKAEVPVSVESSDIPSRRKPTNPWVLRTVGIAGVVGILAVVYLQYGPKRLPALDLLGSSLPEAGLVSQQLAAMQQANALAGKTSAAPAPAPAVAPAVAPAAAQAAPVEQPSPRPAPKRVMVKAKPATGRPGGRIQLRAFVLRKDHCQPGAIPRKAHLWRSWQAHQPGLLRPERQAADLRLDDGVPPGRHRVCRPGCLV